MVDAVTPQALDSATYGIFGYLGAITLYIVYALAKDMTSESCHTELSCETDVDVHNDGSPKPCIPQAEEFVQSVGTRDPVSQNVKFVDTHPGYKTDVLSERDPVRNAVMVTDASLDEFFSRPLRIRTEEWGVNTQLGVAFNPWKLYFQNPRVINRISNYKLLQADLCVKVTINGNAFHYGRAILSYVPLPTLDNMSSFRAFIDVDNVGASQRPHLYIDPTNSQGGEMCLPFFFFKNALDVPSADWNEMGTLTLNTLTPLKHANGAVDTVTVNVFAWAENVKFAIPTQIEPGAIVPQADEYGKGPISRPSSIVASLAAKMANVPAIGPFMRATEIGASAIAGISSLFGYSRPVMLSKSQFKPHPKGDMAVTDIEDDIPKLSVTAKQELSVDPRTVGLSNVDEMCINYVASRESYLVGFPWPVTTATETLLWNCVVDPAVHRIFNDEYHFPASCFASMPFDNWRGTMDFRFQVVCSKYHKGRLKVVYDPSGNPSGAAEYNTAYTTIVDISDTTDFTISCGWGQATSYRERIPLGTNEADMHNVVPLTYNSPALRYGNGTIAVYVVNELTVPNTTIDNDIEINVFVKMCDDFEVASPDGNEVNQLRLTPIPQAEEVVPQAEDVPNDGDEADRMDSAPMATTPVNQMAPHIPLTDYTNHIHYGESIRSFRQLLKRYNLHEVLPLVTREGSGGSNANVITRFIRPLLPFEPGYTTDVNDITYPLIAGSYYYSQMTLMRYLTVGYCGWRGGVRWMYDTSSACKATIGDRKSVLIARERFDQQMDNFSVEQVSPNNPLGQGTLNIYYDESNGQSGAIASCTTLNPIASAEIPYYSINRFSVGKQRVRKENAFNMPKVRVIIAGPSSTSDYVTSWCAAAEDFSCFFFTGAPIFYREVGFPIL